jgi:modulator of FtsH protease HflC
MKKNLIIIFISIFVLSIAFSLCTFTVKENESASILRLGKIVAVYVKTETDQKNVIAGLKEENKKLDDIKVSYGTGLKFKIPFIDQVKKYSNMLLTYDTSPRQVITSDKKKLLFDNNAQWRIDNPALFEITMLRVAQAEQRLDDILYSMMNQKVGKVDSNTLITNKVEVEKIQNDLADQVTQVMKAYGITVFDIRVKRTDLPEENYDSIYKRMITERERIAAQYRSEGDEEALKARSNADKQIIILTSEAKKKAEILKGEGDAQAAKIFNNAYGKDPAFYEFYNTLETYKSTIGANTKLVIPSNSPFAKYLYGNK